MPLLSAPSRFPRWLAVAAAAAAACSEGGAKPTVPYSQATVVGATGSDMFAGMALDSGGAVYLAGTSKELMDRFYADFTVVKLDPAGGLAWARSYGGSGNDTTRPHVDSEGEGPARLVAAAPGGGVFVAGNSTSVDGGFAAALVFRLSSDGDLVWARAWRPHWNNQATGEAFANAVAVSPDGATLYAVGTTGGEAAGLVLAFAADSGDLRWAVSLDPSPGANDRLFSVVAAPSNALYVAGWQGRDNDGLLARLDVSGPRPAVAWAARVDLPLGSTLPDIDVDADGNLLAAADIHGASTWHSVLKLSPAGQLLWARDYNAGSGLDVSTTHVVRACPQGVLVGGRVGYPGASGMETDSQQGDSLWAVLGPDGALLRDVYYFTGDDGASGGGSLDRVRGLAVDQGKLVVMGSIFSTAGNYSGTWRTPASRDITPAFGPAAEVALASFDPGALEDLTAAAPRGGAELSALTLHDVGSQVAHATPAAADGTPRSTQGYVFWFPAVL